MQRGSPVDAFATLLGTFRVRKVFFLATAKPGKTDCVLPFCAGKNLEKLMVGRCAKFFRLCLDFVQTDGGVKVIEQDTNLKPGRALAPITEQSVRYDWLESLVRRGIIGTPTDCRTLWIPARQQHR